MKTLKTFVSIILVLAISNFSYAQTNTPKPDLANVTYGDHERNVLDIWFADKTNKLLWPYTSTEVALAQAVKKKSMEMS